MAISKFCRILVGCLLAISAQVQAQVSAPASDSTNKVDVCSTAQMSMLSERQRIAAMQAPLAQAIATLDNSKVEFSSPTLASGKLSYLTITPSLDADLRHVCVIGYFYFENEGANGDNTEPLDIDHVETVKVPDPKDAKLTIDASRIYFRAPSSDNFSDMVVPGEGIINMIDYIEISDNFYKVAEQIKKIHDKLHGAIAFIAIQKNIGSDLGRGGSFSLEKARLYISLDKGVAKIISAKNFKKDSPIGNPAGCQCRYKLVNGAKIIKDQIQGWHRREE